MIRVDRVFDRDSYIVDKGISVPKKCHKGFCNIDLKKWEQVYPGLNTVTRALEFSKAIFCYFLQYSEIRSILTLAR